MLKIKYELVEGMIAELILQLATSQSIDEQLSTLDEITNYLEACGWTEKEWTEETLRRIDDSWEPKPDNLWIN
jgi:hypothetical protein